MEKSLIPKGPLKRNSSIELLRIIAILMVFTMHTIGNSINRGGEIAENNILIHHIFGAICGVSVTLFILISGYYSITFKLKRFIQIILLTTFYSVLTYLIYVGIGHNSINYSVLAKDILVVPLYDNWFVSCYLVLMLVSPYLNKLLDSLDKHSFKKLLLVLATMISIIPTFFRSCWDSSIVVGGGQSLTTFTLIYILGRYFGKFGIPVVNRKKLLLSYVVLNATIIFVDIVVSIIKGSDTHCLVLDCSPFIILSACLILFMFMTFSFHSRIVNWVAMSVFSVYLCDGLRGSVDRYIHVYEYLDTPLWIVMVIAEVVISFVMAFILDQIRIQLLGKVESSLIECVSKVVRKIVKILC